MRYIYLCICIFMVVILFATSAIAVDESYYTGSADGYIHKLDLNYNTCRTSATGDSVYDTSTVLVIQNSIPYVIDRAYVFFDTSAIPDSANITSAVLKLYGVQDGSATDFDITIQSGMPTYPTSPLATSDYNYSLYAGSGGTLNTASFVTGAYNNINLNATGLSWINKTGTTKFILRSSRDIAGTTPSGYEWVSVCSYEQGAGYRPTLVVTYSLATPEITADTASNVGLNSARLNSTVDFDGYESCQVRWGYGTSSQTDITAYDNVTSWSAAEWDTGEHPYEDISGLQENTSYYWRVQIKNTSYNATSSQETFDTLASVSEPTNFRAYPSSDEVSLSWVKGSGASQTLVRYSLTTYPTTNTSGTLVYLGEANNYIHEDLSAGHTYYYSAWGIASANVSADYATVAVTTDAFSISTGDEFEEPVAFGNWFLTPDHTGLSGLEPIYSAINGVADGLGIDANYYWMMLALMFTVVVIVVLCIAGKSMTGFVIGGIILVIFCIIGLVPGWIICMIAMISFFVWIASDKLPVGGQ